MRLGGMPRRCRLGRRGHGVALAAATALAVAVTGSQGRGLYAFTGPATPTRPHPAAAAALQQSFSQGSLHDNEDAASQSGRQAETSSGLGAWFRAAALIGAVSVALLGPPSTIPGLPGQTEAAWARPNTNAMGSRVNKDPTSLLQLALPLEEVRGEKEVETLRALQNSVETVKGNALQRLWSSCQSAVDETSSILTSRRQALIKPVAAERKAEAEQLLAKLEPEVESLREAVKKGVNAEQASFRDQEAAEATIKTAETCQKLVGELEETVLPVDYAAPVPADVDASLPRLNGRAVIEMKLKRPENSDQKKFTEADKLFEEATLKIVADGWSAPISAGNWVDLVDRGFYNGMKIQRADGFIIQTGDPGAESKHGFRPTPDSKVRTIPLEVALTGKKQAIYGETTDEARLVGAQVKIPFQADGVISMAREEFDNDSASSQFFMIIFESDMTPAGKNFLDGRYGSFGFTVEGSNFLRQVAEGDIITEAKVVSGIDKLKKA